MPNTYAHHIIAVFMANKLKWDESGRELLKSHGRKSNKSKIRLG